MNDPPAQKPRPPDLEKKGDIAAMTVMMSLCQNCAVSKERRQNRFGQALKAPALNACYALIRLQLFPPCF